MADQLKIWSGTRSVLVAWASRWTELSPLPHCQSRGVPNLSQLKNWAAGAKKLAFIWDGKCTVFRRQIAFLEILKKYRKGQGGKGARSDTFADTSDTAYAGEELS